MKTVLFALYLDTKHKSEALPEYEGQSDGFMRSFWISGRRKDCVIIDGCN